MRHLNLPALLTVFALAGPALAQAPQLDGCDVGVDEYDEIVLPVLDGAWTAAHGAGLVVVSNGGQTMTQPIPPDAERDPVNFTYDDGRVLVSGPDMAFYEVETVPLEESTDYSVPLGEGGSEIALDLGAVETPPNCTPDLLPRLRWSGEMGLEGADGLAHFEVIVHMLNENTLSGIMILNTSAAGGQLHARRLITITR